MQWMQKKKLIGLLCISLIFFVACFYWFIPNNKHRTVEKVAVSNQSNPTVENISGVVQTDKIIYQSTSQQDTEINCQLKIDGVNRLIVNMQTRDCFEYFIGAYGEFSLDEINNIFQQYIRNNYSPSIQEHVLTLWSRYLQYRQALSELSNQPLHTTNQHDLRENFADIKRLRTKFFSRMEIDGLFAIEDVYQDYTLDRLDILNNDAMSEIEKAQQLTQRFEQLPKDWQQNLKELTTLENLRTLTQQIKARNGSSQELRNMRIALVGVEATNRLETLDNQRQQWKNRVTSYLNGRENILQSTMSPQAKKQAVIQLQQQQFPQPQERVRLNTFEQIHDQGGVLPFNP